MRQEKSSFDWLPAGWRVQIRVRKSGKKDTYNPTSSKLESTKSDDSLKGDNVMAPHVLAMSATPFQGLLLTLDYQISFLKSDQMLYLVVDDEDRENERRSNNDSFKDYTRSNDTLCQAWDWNLERLNLPLMVNNKDNEEKL
ncbi:hypothetical protein ACH5RR_036358 [Cinchona calisaya]|uniref:Uncharacterized protein n=1 Tax=Cinchona calisaya TaxID=153742 RepID=A0ABD2Y6J4_9GENT